MTTAHTYDAAIIGGGLAGLCLSIQLAREGHRVILFEKEKYPFHKVCGEYISFECWNFLEEIGVPLSDWHLPHINNLLVSSRLLLNARVNKFDKVERKNPRKRANDTSPPERAMLI